MNQDLINYVRQARSEGMSDDAIRSALLGAGWDSVEVNSVIAGIVPQSISPIMGSSPAQSHSSAVQAGSATINQEDFIRRWSWGGFLLYFLYFLGSRNYKRAFLYFLGATVPFLGIYLWIKSGLRGRKLVWGSGKWQDFESYRRRQVLLDRIGLVLLVLSLLGIAAGVFGMFSLEGNKSSTAIEFSAPSSTVQEQNIQPQPAVATAQNCGSLDSDRTGLLVFESLAKATPAEKKIVDCMDTAVKSCNIAYLTITKGGQEIERVEIQGKESDACVITQKLSTEKIKGTVTCKVSSAVIAKIVTKAEQQNASLSLNLAGAMEFEQAKGTPGLSITGGEELNCTKTQ